MKLLILSLLLTSIGFSQEYDPEGAEKYNLEKEEKLFVDSGEENIFFREKDFISPNFKKSHFFMNLETSLLMYKSDNFFDGKQAQVRPTDSLPLIGPSLGLGYRFKLGSFSTSSQVNFFHYVNRDHFTDKASEEIPINISEQENDNSITGAEFAQRFYMTFQISERNYIEPFVQVGVGYAISESKYEHFYYDYIDSEYYYSSVTEQLITQNLAVGFNIMNQNGLFFIFKVQKNILTIGERESEISTFPYQANLGVPTTVKSTVDINTNRDEYSVTLGGGYVF